MANAGAMSVATYPIDQRYDVGFGFGLRVMQRFSWRSHWYWMYDLAVESRAGRGS